MPTFGYYLNALGRCGGTFRAERMAGTGVGPHDQAYLFHICRHPGLSQEALGRALCVHKSHVTRHITHLEKEGFVTRTPDSADRRVLLVYPTQKAERILPRLREVSAEWRAILTADFSQEELATFEDLLARALENAKGHILGEGEKE